MPIEKGIELRLGELLDLDFFGVGFVERCVLRERMRCCERHSNTPFAKGGGREIANLFRGRDAVDAHRQPRVAQSRCEPAHFRRHAVERRWNVVAIKYFLKEASNSRLDRFTYVVGCPNKSRESLTGCGKRDVG